MRYHVKEPGAFLWKPIVTDSLVSELEQGRIKGDWKIRNDNNSTDYTVDELCQLEARRKTEKTAAPIAPQALGAAADSTTDGQLPRGAKMFFLLSLYLIITFLYRALVPANEYDSIPVVYMSLGLDLLMLVGLILGKIGISREISADQRGGVVSFVFVIALLAGVGLLAIRLTSDASWWTGHLRYEIPGRR